MQTFTLKGGERAVDDSQCLTQEFVLACGSHTLTQWLINLGFWGAVILQTSVSHR